MARLTRIVLHLMTYVRSVLELSDTLAFLSEPKRCNNCTIVCMVFMQQIMLSWITILPTIYFQQLQPDLQYSSTADR